MGKRFIAYANPTKRNSMNQREKNHGSIKNITCANTVQRQMAEAEVTKRQKSCVKCPRMPESVC